jgi:electron transfer flavoprotein alpha subunit
MSDVAANDVLVIVEGVDPARDRIASEQIATAQAVARATGGNLIVGVIGADAGLRARHFAGYAGVSAVLSCEDAALDPYVNGGWLRAATTLAAEASAGVVLLPATLAGRDIAPRLALRLDAAMISDVTGFETGDNGQRRFQRQVEGGRFVTWVTAGSSRAVVATMRPGTNRQEPVPGEPAPIRSVAVTLTPQDKLVEVVETTGAEKEAQGIATAARIVSGGRGLGKPENFSMIEALAKELDAAVGASGAVVGLGWRPHSQQVGSTGTTVTPRLYLAVGISGAVQHTIGMAGSDNIVAINRDPAAPIFQIASLGVVGDLFEIVPALIAALQAARG